MVRECDYQSEAFGVHVKVRRSSLYTTVTVNGIDVYFYRLTGCNDGIGFSQPSGCTKGSTQKSEAVAAPSSPPPYHGRIFSVGISRAALAQLQDLGERECNSLVPAALRNGTGPQS